MLGGWTRGRLYACLGSDRKRLANDYAIETLDGHRVLVVEMKSCRDSDGRASGRPLIYVYEQIDNIARTSDEIAKHDGVSLEFELDEAMLGRWRVVDFCSNRKPEELDLTKRHFPEERLCVRGLNFRADGICELTPRTSKVEYGRTKWYNLNRRSRVALTFERLERGDRELLLMQWKSGDYLYAGRINTYILER